MNIFHEDFEVHLESQNSVKIKEHQKVSLNIIIYYKSFQQTYLSWTDPKNEVSKGEIRFKKLLPKRTKMAIT